MEQLPQIVRDRLNRHAADPHPDADLLAAFAERKLSGWEREPILEHLAQCQQCRHVLSLAAESAPQVVSGDPAPSVPAQHLRHPSRLRWAAVAASLALVSAAGMLFYGRRAHRFPPAEMASAERHVAGSDLHVASATKPSTSEAPSTQQPRKLESLTAKSQSAAQKIREEVKSSLSFDGTKDVPKVAAEAAPFNRRALGKILQSPKTEPTSPASPPSVLAFEPSKAATSRDKIPGEAIEVGGNAPVPLAASARTPKVKESSRAGNVQMGNTALTETSASVHGPTLMSDWVTPQWTLSDDGLPQRSFDSGKTWEKVQVDHTTGFRALSAYGIDVWVGGPAGALYHSADFGLHWTRVAVVSGGDSLTSEIVRLDFSDGVHGTLTTSADQIWITSDAGKTWQKR